MHRRYEFTQLTTAYASIDVFTWRAYVGNASIDAFPAVVEIIFTEYGTAPGRKWVDVPHGNGFDHHPLDHNFDHNNHNWSFEDLIICKIVI